MNTRLPEILAPAGDLNCLKAAVSAGADAVYFGGELFNARKNAGNFSTEEIQEAAKLCRLHGVKTNFTLNILIKDCEWERLNEYLDQILPLGIDALIIQDIGVARLVARKIKDTYPWIQLHGSTQMAVEDADGARYLKELGFSRVVLARELTLKEIKEITSSVDIETEVFVHGALCYSDSGRCLLSSFHGGRSGNRGTCAQVCRLQYIADGRKEYYMNLKDRCTTTVMQELLEAGVSSLKIEGRMKGIPYVTAVTGFYRSMLDSYAEGRPFADFKEKLEEVKQVFNRGDFTEGYYTNKDHMIEKGSVKHQGIEIGRVERVKGSVTIRSEKTLHSGDELEIVTSGINLPIRLSEGMLTRDHHSASFKLAGKIREGQRVRRIVDPVLHQQLRDRSSEIPRIPVDLSMRAIALQPLSISVSCGSFRVTVKGAPVQMAQKAPVTRDQMQKLLSRTGESFEARGLQIQMDEDIFVPVAQVNALRREALGKLEEKMLLPQSSKDNGAIHEKLTAFAGESENVASVQAGNGPEFLISVDLPVQYDTLKEMDLPSVKAVILSMEGFASCSPEERKKLCQELKERNIRSVVRLPRVGRLIHESWILKELKLWMEAGIRGAEACRMGQLYRLELLKQESKEDFQVSLGPDMGVMNTESGCFYASGDLPFSLSRELSIPEMTSILEVPGASCVLYGKVPFMVTEQCVYKERHGCEPSKAGHAVLLKDRQDEDMTVISHCPLCYSEIFSGKPVYPEDPKVLFEMAQTLRIEWTNETQEEIRDNLPLILKGKKIKMDSMEGHFVKGVE